MFLFRVLICLPKRLKSKTNVTTNNKIKTLIVFGSGGHTTEMLKLIESFGGINYDPVCFVLSNVSLIMTSHSYNIETLQSFWHIYYLDG